MKSKTEHMYIVDINTNSSGICCIRMSSISLGEELYQYCTLHIMVQFNEGFLYEHF